MWVGPSMGWVGLSLTKYLVRTDGKNIYIFIVICHTAKDFQSSL